MKKLSKLVITFISIFNLISCGTGGIGGGSGSDDVQYAALGASDATGVGASPFTNGYVYLIKESLENEGKSTNLMNYGVPDIEIGGVRDVEIKLLRKGNRPDLVTLFVGANDIIAGATPSHFETDLTVIFQEINNINTARVFIADIPNLTVLPRFVKDKDKDVTIERVRQFNEIIHRLARRFGATVIALSNEPQNDSFISNDGLHPNNDGYRRIADLFLQDILPEFVL